MRRIAASAGHGSALAAAFIAWRESFCRSISLNCAEGSLLILVEAQPAKAYSSGLKLFGMTRLKNVGSMALQSNAVGSLPFDRFPLRAR